MNEPHVEPESVPTVGEVILAALAERGWTQDDLASVLGWQRPEINLVIQGKRGVSAKLALALSEALGQSPEYWLQLDAARQLRQVEDGPRDVGRRARLYDVAPIKDMVRRGWLPETRDTDALERALCEFLAVPSLDVEPALGVAARKSNRSEPLSAAQRAWVYRARQLGAALPVAEFNPDRLDDLGRKLREFAAYPEEIRHLPRAFAEFGIRFVVVEPLPDGGIDGAVIWLDHQRPVIAVSVRYDRIDGFWFTVCHEFSHVRHRDEASIDTDLVGRRGGDESRVDQVERRADAEAAALLVPPEQLDSFVKRVGPLYSKAKLAQFAHRIRIHPGIIVGQLQHRGEIKYSHNREMLVKVRHRIVSTAVTDGWGQSVGTV